MGLTQNAIGGFNAKAGAVATKNSLERPVQVDENVEKPFLMAFLVLAWYHFGNHSHCNCGAVGESVGCAIAFASTTQFAGAALFASNRASQKRRLLYILQIGDDRTATETSIHIEYTDA